MIPNVFQGALGALKKKKMYEAEMEKTYGAKMTLEQQLTTIEGAQVNLRWNLFSLF